MSVSTQSGYRLSPEQTRIWSHLSQGRILNTYSLARVSKPLDLNRLSDAFQVLAQNFDIIRTIFPGTKERKFPLQTVQDSVEVPVTQVSLDASESVQNYANKQASIAFDHESGVLIRAELIQNQTEQYVLIVASSMLVDAGSISSIWTVIDQILNNTFEQQEVLQYPQIAVWQQDLVQEADAEVRAFWNNYPHKTIQNSFWALKSVQTSSDTISFGAKSVKLDSKLMNDLQHKATQLETDLSGLLTVMLTDLMGRYSGSDHLNITITDPVRGFDELKDLIGNLSTSIPWKYDKRFSKSEVKDLLGQIQKLREYSLYFDSEKMSIEGPKSALTDAEIQLPVQVVALHNFDIECIISMRGCHGLQCSVVTGDHSIHVQWSAPESVVASGWIDELAKQTIVFLKWSLQHLGSDSWKNSWLSVEKQSEVATLSGVKIDTSDVPLLVEHLITAFNGFGPGMAVVHGMKWLNFKQVQQQSQRIARNLVAKGITTGSKVGILLPRSIDAVIGILGVVQAGACYVPIDTEYPDSRISFMIEDADLSALITSAEFKDRFDEKINCVEVSELTSGDPTDVELPSIKGSDPVYCIYTSGSTGNPKGCIITHEQLSWYLNWIKGTYFDGISGTSVPLFTSLAFDLTVTTIFGSLISGNCLTIFDESVPLPQVLETVFDSNGSTEVLKMTPAHALVLATTPLKSTAVKRVVIGGEALLPAHVKTLLDLNPKLTIYNEYGPTETVVGCSVDVISKVDQHITIGTPVDHASMYVVDSEMNILPVGVPGELVIGGRSVGQGYYKRQELTDSRFTTLPLSKERVYRSGDLAYVQLDNKFAFLGRTDSQVKIRGYRIEPDEIRTRLLQLSGISDAFVTTSTYTDDSLHLVGYVVCKSNFDEDRIKNTLSDVLPAYMIPSFVLNVDSIPLTINGKVDTKALPDLASYLQQRKRVIRHPENTLQHDLAMLWKEVLGVDELSIDDNFFDLGGHSLKAMQIVSRIQHQLKQNLLLSDFFDHVTIEQLEKHLSGGSNPASSTIPKSEEASSYPSSGPQRRLWVLDKLPGAKRAYHVSEVYNLRGSLDVHAFNTAIRSMIARHESLRTSFKSINDVPVQVIHDRVDPLVEYIDATIVPDIESWTQQVTESVLQTPFDLGSPSLFRSVLIKTGDNDYRWVSCMHHIISDGWSVDLMVGEIQELYLAQIEKRPARLPELRIQYKDVSIWLESRINDPEYQNRENYWIDQFSGAQVPVTFPFQKARPTLKTYSGGAVKRQLNPQIVKQVQSLQRQGHSTFLGLTTALTLAIRQVLKRDEFVIGTPVAGRFLPEMEPLIGFFVNMVPLKMVFQDDNTVHEALKHVRSIVLNALEHQDVSFDTWTSKLHHQVDPSRSPIFDVMIVYHNNPASNWKSAGFTLEQVPIEEKHSKYDLAFEFTDRTESIEFRVDFNSTLFDASTIQSFCDYVELVAASIFADPNTKIQELPVPPPTLTTPLSYTTSSTPHPTPVTHTHSQESNRTNAISAAWKKALGRDTIRPSDNFFALGGDSIKAIQLASSLFQQGYQLPIATLFSYPTIAELESRLIEISQTGSNEPVSGTHHPTPIQRWLLDLDPDTRNGFFQTAQLIFDHPVPLHVIHAAWLQIMLHHDELRARVISNPDATELHIPANDVRFGFRHVELDQDAADVISRATSDWLKSWLPEYSVESDSLCQLLVISTPSKRYLSIAIHHLVVDIVSWRILLEDLNTLLSSLMKGETVDLPMKSTSFMEWISKADVAMDQDLGQKALAFWSHETESIQKGLIHANLEDQLTSSRIEISDFDKTLHSVASSFHASISDILMTAVSRVIQTTSTETHLTFAYEGHGRDLLIDIPVDRTVGWFTCEYPVSIEYNPDVVRHLREVKESRVKAERYGAWFLLLAESDVTEAVQQRGIGINYLGDVGFEREKTGWFEVAGQDSMIDEIIESRLDLGKSLSLVAHVFDDILIIQVDSRLSGTLASEPFSEKLKTELLKVSEALQQSTDVPVHTPSDFDYDGLDLDNLDDLLNSIK